MQGSLCVVTYQWRAKGPQFLANSGNFTKTSGPPYIVNVEMGLMRTGDCNDGNNMVNIFDYNLHKGNFGRGRDPPIRPGK